MATPGQLNVVVLYHKNESCTFHICNGFHNSDLLERVKIDGKKATFLRQNIIITLRKPLSKMYHLPPI